MEKLENNVSNSGKNIENEKSQLSIACLNLVSARFMITESFREEEIESAEDGWVESCIYRVRRFLKSFLKRFDSSTQLQLVLADRLKNFAKLITYRRNSQLFPSQGLLTHLYPSALLNVYRRQTNLNSAEIDWNIQSM